MRGKPYVCACRGRSYRITPADAGKTERLILDAEALEDHPRGCGENLLRAFEFWQVPGSPPRMRGKHSRSQLSALWRRITPADAGKTPSCTTFAPLVQDHPRGCGENIFTAAYFYRQSGSPPRMRGKRRGRRTPALDSGITPADAGKTTACVHRINAAWDHPRGCGENFDVLIITPKQIGSPPRMRGKH